MSNHDSMTDWENKKQFDHHCICGGYNWRRNGRPESQPHMAWCPQFKEYGEWWRWFVDTTTRTTCNE